MIKIISSWFIVHRQDKSLIRFQSKGFTLVETLVAMGIIAILGVILTQLFYTSLRGDNKAQVIGSIKQNGDAALESIKANIRDSDQVVASCPLGILVVKGGTYTRYRIVPEQANANGKILVDYPALTPQQIDAADELANACTTDIQTNPTSLTDDSAASGVSVLDGSFGRNQLPGYKDSVTVSFTLKPGLGNPVAITNQVTPVNFTTTVGLR